MVSIVVRALKVHHLRFEYPVASRFRYAGGLATARLTSLIEVESSDGQVGWGSVYSNPALVEQVVRHLRPHVVNRPLGEPKDLWQQLYLLTRWYGRKGAAISTIGGIDTAYWDLYAQAKEKPLFELLGGDAGLVPAYASALLWNEDIECLAADSKSMIENGFVGVKMRLGVSEEYDRTALRSVRQSIGNDAYLHVDGSHQYTLEAATKLIPLLEEHAVRWFEEPFPPEDIRSHIDLSKRTSIGLAAGENEFGEDGFQALIDSQAFAFVQPDVSRCGGVSVATAVARSAATAGINLAPHTWSDMLAVTANAHVVAAAPRTGIVEVDQTGNELIDRLLVEPPIIAGGFLSLPPSPGLGVVPDPDAITAFRYEIENGVPDGNYSDMVFGSEFVGSPRSYGDQL